MNLTIEQIQNFEFLPLGKDGCRKCKHNPLYYCKACERKIEAALLELDKLFPEAEQESPARGE